LGRKLLVVEAGRSAADDDAIIDRLNLKLLDLSRRALENPAPDFRFESQRRRWSCF
jgi:hypothetical protein